MSSVPKMLEFARLVYGFGIRRLVLAKVFGAAAQQIGDLFKLAFKAGGQVLVFNGLDEAVELLRPDAVYAVTKPESGAKPLDGLQGRHVMLVVHGSDLAFSQKELPPQAVPIYGVDRDIGSLGQLAVILYNVTARVSSPRPPGSS